MKPKHFPIRSSHESAPHHTVASSGPVRRVLLLGAAFLAVAASASAAVTDLSGDLTQVLDTAIGGGNPGA